MLRLTLLNRCVLNAAVVVVAFLAPRSAHSQSTPAENASAKKVLSVDDYTKWRAIEGAQISSNGRWVASVFRFTNVVQGDTKPELHLRNTETNQDVVIPNASSPTFSLDSRWLVYQVDSMPARANGRGGRAGGAGADSAPPQTPGAGGRAAAAAGPQALRRFELRDLTNGTTQRWKDVQSATFANSSMHLILRRTAGTVAES